MKYSKKGLLLTAVFACIMVVFLLLFGITEWICGNMTADLDALNGGERWSAAGEEYATLVMHTDDNTALSEYEVESYVSSIDKALEEAAVTSSDRGSIWAYSFYGEGNLQLKGPKSSATANVMYVGGSFFTFHPLEFLYGSPFTYDPTLPDGVVLDEDLAWRLFGTLNVVGMEIPWNERVLTVTGIVAKERNSDAYEKAYGDMPRMYMSYYGYKEGSYTEGGFITFEATVPNPVDGFADGIFRNAVQIREDSMILKENSSRYTFLNRCRIIPTLPYMGRRIDRIVYPYFENELQTVDFHTALWTLTGLICLGIGVLSFLTALICLFKSGFSPTKILKQGVIKTIKHIEKHKNRKITKEKRRRI